MVAPVIDYKLPERDKDRCTGRTTKQMLAAPRNAVYVQNAGPHTYHKLLAAHLHRDDLRIISPDQIENTLHGKVVDVVVDHAARLTDEQMFLVMDANTRKSIVAPTDAVKHTFAAAPSSKTMVPTMHLQFSATTGKLQQGWVPSGGGHVEWRDVPMEEV